VSRSPGSRFSILHDVKIAQDYGDPTQFQLALRELNDGAKKSHWIWFILPQLANLGISSNSKKYGLIDQSHAQQFLEDPDLRERFLVIVDLLARKLLEEKTEILDLMGSHIDAKKMISSLTLFEVAGVASATEILNKFGRCAKTQQALGIAKRENLNHATLGGNSQGKKVGLTLGKFAPFHKGHQFVIESALREVDHLKVIVYEATDVTRIPLEVRTRWIERIYPSVEVIRGYEGPQTKGDGISIQKEHEDYVTRVLGINGITHFFSSEIYGEHMSKHLGAINCVVDLQRFNFPISATMIRENPYRYKRYLNPIVYRSLIHNVVFLGGPGSGKSSITSFLSSKCETAFMPEFGREYWERFAVQRRLSTHQLLEIALTHLKRENELLESANNYLFTDTNALTTHLFSMYYHGESLPGLKHLAESCFSRYDSVFVCSPDFPYPDTVDRSGEANRQYLHDATVSALTSLHVPFKLLSGSLDARVDQVMKHLRLSRKQ